MGGLFPFLKGKLPNFSKSHHIILITVSLVFAKAGREGIQDLFCSIKYFLLYIPFPNPTWHPK